ncbi:MAG: hypothetical protein JAY90_12015 [Candidatus Thiodiazotropha lotti]|nr:hypothetical protein [Candidatus Thiodiazotropha lotti]
MKTILFLKLCAITLIMSACNNSDDQLPPNTQVQVAPSSYTWTVTELLNGEGQCIYDNNVYQDTIVQISVLDGNDRPIGEVDISMYLSPSNSTSPIEFNNEYVFYLYDDFNGNGVVDHPQELVSSTGDSILYEAQTEKYHGTKYMIIRTNTSCGGFRATLGVFAGSAYGSMGISTEARDDSL